MGRRIPTSKRHKKLKNVDPFYSGDRRSLLIKNAKTLDSAPSKANQQEIPRKVREYMAMKKLMAEGKMPKAKRKRRRQTLQDGQNEFGVRADEPDLQPGMTDRPLKPTPVFRKMPHETDRSFIKRVYAITESVIAQTKLENKFGVDIYQDSASGKVTLVTRDNKDELLDEAMKSVKKTDKKRRKKEQGSHKREKRKALEQKAKEKKRLKLEDKQSDFHHLQDKVAFGEVISHPPNHLPKPRRADKLNNSKKAKSESLLLSNLFQNSSERKKSEEKKKKRKHPTKSPAQQQILAEEKERVRAAYREMKKAKAQKIRGSS